MPTLYRKRVIELLPLEIIASIDIIIPIPPTSLRLPQISPSSPTLKASDQVLTVKDARKLLKLLIVFRATQTLQPIGEANLLVETRKISGDEEQVVARASKLQFKAVNKI